jgi:hypothetical protein
MLTRLKRLKKRCYESHVSELRSRMGTGFLSWAVAGVAFHYGWLSTFLVVKFYLSLTPSLKENT